MNTVFRSIFEIRCSILDIFLVLFPVFCPAVGGQAPVFCLFVTPFPTTTYIPSLLLHAFCLLYLPEGMARATVFCILFLAFFKKMARKVSTFVPPQTPS